MASYYYYASTLPTLRLDGPMPYSVASFLDEAKNHVKGRNWTLLVAAATEKESKSSILSAWQSHKRLLASELASQRSKRKGYRGTEYPHHDEAEQRICETVRQALSLDDPLKAELLLLELSWKRIDELVGLDAFSINALVAYVLKLGLLERKSHFDQVSGNSEFKRIFANLQIEIAKQ